MKYFRGGLFWLFLLNIDTTVQQTVIPQIIPTLISGVCSSVHYVLYENKPSDFKLISEERRDSLRYTCPLQVQKYTSNFMYAWDIESTALDLSKSWTVSSNPSTIARKYVKRVEDDTAEDPWISSQRRGSGLWQKLQAAQRCLWEPTREPTSRVDTSRWLSEDDGYKKLPEALRDSLKLMFSNPDLSNAKYHTTATRASLSRELLFQNYASVSFAMLVVSAFHENRFSTRMPMQ